jgi:hypothetical protein
MCTYILVKSTKSHISRCTECFDLEAKVELRSTGKLILFKRALLQCIAKTKDGSDSLKSSRKI